MNILFLVPYAPTPIRTRPYNFIRNLARRGHAVTLATLWENERELQALDDLEQDHIRIVSEPLTKCRSMWNSVRVLPTSIPLQAVYCWQPTLLQQLDAQIRSQRFDAIHIEHLRGARYGLWLKSRLPIDSRPKVIWDSVDCISHLFEQAAHSSRSLFGRLVTRLELNRTRRYEGRLVGQFDRVLVTSPVDKNALEHLASSDHRSKEAARDHADKIAVLSNGVDLNFFAPMDQVREPDTLVFSGKMSYHANVTAALHLVEDIMPLIWAQKPNVRVWIVGKDPPAAIRQLAIHDLQRVSVTGTVPDIRPYLARAAVATCPVEYGAGVQNKVLEAMAMATPVVVTPQAVSALQTVDGEHVLVGASSPSFAGSVLRVLENTELQRKIGQAGRRYVEQYHNWDVITQHLEGIYQ